MNTIYLLMMALGAVSIIFFVWIRRKQLNLTSLQSILFAILIGVAGFLTGKILYALLNLRQLFSGSFPDGLTLFGPIFLEALIVPYIGCLFGVKRQHAQDIVGCCLALFNGVLSIGCYFAGCCSGKVISIMGHAVRWPAQALSSIFCFTIFALLLEQEKKGKYEGRLYPLFLVYYGTYRFLDEFLRITEKDMLLLSIWQWLSIVAVMIGYIWNKQAKEKRNAKS